MMRRHEAAENVRLQQQGHGRPIISWTDHGYRLVAVGSTIFWGKNWLVFPDFVLHFMKKTLGNEWGAREKDKGAHPVFRWLAKFQRFSDSLPKEGKLKTGNVTGFMACMFHLGYTLYLIAHNDEIPKRLLRRLREPSTFMPAYYEAIIGAALSVAGFEITSAETKATSEPTPEFRAKSKTTGRVYEVEAKRRDRWKAPTDDVKSPEFERELEAYVRNQVHAASKKKLKNPIYWFELSVPTLQTEAEWRHVAGKVEDVIRQAEKTMTVEGEPIQPAFVGVSNLTFLANEDCGGAPWFAVLTPIKIDDYPFGRMVETEAALEAFDKYRDIFWMMDAWKIARNLPVTFDGTPPELLSADGEPQRTIQIGDVIEVPDDEGKNVRATVTEIASMGNEAAVAVTANGRHWLVKMPLSEGEAEAAERYSDAIFGKDNASRGLRENDPFDLYDFLLRSRSTMTQENVAKWFERHPHLQQFKDLPLEEARRRIAREETKWTWERSQQRRRTEAELNEAPSISTK
jgi:hypothetical protein